MEDERGAESGPNGTKDEGSECSRDSYKSGDSSSRTGNQSALATIDEKITKLHNGEPEHVSSDEDSVVEERNSIKTTVRSDDDNDIGEKESLESEEEDFKLHVDVDVSSDQEGSDPEDVVDADSDKRDQIVSGISERACCANQDLRVNIGVDEESEVIELSAGEDDDCEVVEINEKEERSGKQKYNLQEEIIARKENNSSVEVVDIDDSAELDDLEIEDSVEVMVRGAVVEVDAIPVVEDGVVIEEEAELGESAELDDELEENDELRGNVEMEGNILDHEDTGMEEALEDRLEKRGDKSGNTGEQEESAKMDVNETDASETEEQRSEPNETVRLEDGSSRRDIDSRTVAVCGSDEASWEGDLSAELSDADDFIGFEPSEPHSFYKEFRQNDGPESKEGEILGTLHISTDGHFFTLEGCEGSAAASGSEAGDSSRFSPVPTESSRCNSPSASSVSGERRSTRKRHSLDVTNPQYLKPFELGWKRELVYRSSLDSSNRRMADVYYYTPTNKKVRSAREVLEYVDGVELTIKNFLFTKEPMGLDCSRETIRDARKSINTREVLAPKEGKDDGEVLPLAPTKTPEKQKSPRLTEMAPTPVAPKSPLSQAVVSSPMVVLRKAATTPTLARSFPRIKVTPTRVQKEGAAASKVSLVKRTQPRPLLPKPREERADQDLEMGMLPPLWSGKAAAKKAAVSTTWSSTPKGKERGRKRASSLDEGPPTKQACTEDHVADRVHPMQNFVHDVCVVYNVFQHVFRYLKVQELLRAARVCRLWRDLAQHSSLWGTVHMKNSKVSDWHGLASTLSARRTLHLDLRKMLLPQRSDEVADMWQQFCLVIGRMDSLERLDLCRCPASVVQHVLTACPNLRTLNATAISCNSISLQDAGSLCNVEELRLKSLSGITLHTSLNVLSQLSSLKHLALTTFRNLGQQGVDVIGSLQNLELLELGEVNNLPASFPSESLAKLSKLRRLRLEKVQGLDMLTFNYLETARSLPQLTQLELVNFDVKPGFDTILASCSNIRKLLIIPTYVTQSATTNRMVLGGVLQLSASLQQFVWGVTHELLRVTELFVDQCDVDQLKKEQLKKGDCIPVLKPVPGIAAVHSPSDTWSCEEKYGGPTPSVEILSLPKLHKLLNLQLPNTKVKLLKIPFHATWRQYLSDMHT